MCVDFHEWGIITQLKGMDIALVARCRKCGIEKPTEVIRKVEML